jgi:molybdenum cofactor cytidylyltransferase
MSRRSSYSSPRILRARSLALTTLSTAVRFRPPRRVPQIPDPIKASRKPGRVGGVILAAGAATRFGSPKQLAEFAGRPLLEHALLAVSNARTVGEAVVVIGANADRVLSGVDLHGVAPVLCADWPEGQAASLRAGVAALGERCEALVVILGDQPAIDPRAIDRVVNARAPGRAAIRASYDGRPGHPVLIERELFTSLAALRGDAGARSVLDRASTWFEPCDGLGSDLDIDTPAQLAQSPARSDPPASAESID